MSFRAAAHLWWLLAVGGLAAAYVWAQLRRRASAVRFTNVSLLASVAPKRPGWRRHLSAAALLLSLAASVLALARPERPVRVPRERATIVMAIDTSVSMEATDVRPSRLAAAKAAASAFVDRLPPRLNVGLVSFAGTAQVLVSPTVEHDLVKQAIGRLRLAPRTAIGEAVFASLDTIKSTTEAPDAEPAPARIVLMSDGETTVGRRNEDAATAAAAAQVPVSTIAYGTDEGTVSIGEETVLVPVNREALRRIAEITGGSFFEAGSAERLRQVYDDLGTSVGYTTRRREATTWFVGAALLLGLLAGAGSVGWSARLP